MRIALAQLNPKIGALSKNLEKIKHYYLDSLQGGADLVVFTELALAGYPPGDLLNYHHFLEREKTLINNELLPLTAQHQRPILIGATHHEGNRLYNAAFYIEDGKVKSTHFKTLLPYFDVFDETRYFTSSTENRVVQIGGLSTAVTICEDIWNDSDFFQFALYDTDPLENLFKQGAELLINLSASPYHLGKHALREKMLPFLAKKYNTAVIYLNQVGGNDELVFDGSSLVYNNRGQLIYRARGQEEELFYVDTADLFKPAPRVITPDKDDIGTLKSILQLGTGDYFRKTGFSKAVLGLSGGIDSAVVAALATETLGSENVLGVIMPSPYSSEHSRADALRLAENLGIKCREISITGPFNAFLELLNGEKEPLLDLAEENLQARLRGNILMHISNREGYLALVTGNKSELAVGYCTLYGDMAGGLAMLSDVPKTTVYALANHINEERGREIIPLNTINKAPSAELRPDQKDEDSLPPYEILDPILELYLEKNYSPSSIAARGYDPVTVNRVIKMVDTSEYKRIQAATGLRISPNSFGRGRKMPVARGYELF